MANPVKLHTVLANVDQTTGGAAFTTGEQEQARANIDAAKTLTTAQMNACNSGITSAKVSSYDSHVADTDIHVTTTDRTTWNGKQDKPSSATENNIATFNSSKSTKDSGMYFLTSSDTWDVTSDAKIPTAKAIQARLDLKANDADVLKGAKFANSQYNLLKSNGIVTIPYSSYVVTPDPEHPDSDITTVQDGVLDGLSKHKLDEIVSFKTISAGGNILSASTYNSILSVTGSGGVSVAIDNGKLKISSDAINNGELKVKFNGEGNGIGTGFTANSQAGATFNISAASYSTSGGTTTYSAGCMTGQDKEKLDNLYPIEYTVPHVATTIVNLGIYEINSNVIKLQDRAVSPSKTFGYLVPDWDGTSMTKCLMYRQPNLEWAEPQTLQVKHWSGTNSNAGGNTSTDAITIPLGQVAICEITYNKNSCAYINVNCHGSTDSWIVESSQTTGMETLALNRICFIADANSEAKTLKVESRPKSSNTMTMDLTVMYGIVNPVYSNV